MTQNLLTLKQYRKQAKITAKKVGEHLGVSERHVYSWEDGSHAIGTHHLMQLMALYGINPTVTELKIILPTPQPKRQKIRT